MDEWVDVLDEDGRHTGKRILKSDAHRKGVFHPTVHIWFFTPPGEVLLQLRSALKKTFPGLWDVSVAGHIETGEDITQAALREVREEIGLEVREEDLIPVGIYKSVQKHENGIVDCEFHHTYISVLKAPISNLEVQEEEVAGIRLLPLEEWEEELKKDRKPSKYVPHDPSYYDAVIDAIRKNL